MNQINLGNFRKVLNHWYINGKERKKKVFLRQGQNISAGVGLVYVCVFTVQTICTYCNTQ